jgi:MFS superfamily sulfate permease-like transporter
MPNRDLFSLGACNLASGILHGMPVGAGYSATAANERFGASSRLSGLVAALMVLPVVWLLMPMIALIPKPVLAAIVIHAVSHTLTIATFRPYFAWRRDHILIVSSVMAVLALGVMNGLLVAVGISLFLLLRQMSAASITQLGRHGRREHDFVNLQTFPKAMPIPGVIILRPDQALFFANADRIMSKLRETISATDPSVHAVVLSLEQTTNLDSVVLEGLRDLAIYTANLDKRLVLARVKDDVYELLQHTIIPTQPNLGISRLSVAHAVSLALEPEWEEKEPELDLSPR